MEFSLSFFSSTGNESGESMYGFVTRSSRYADKHGFTAVWTPERHFHPFGGIFPNPALMGVLLATTTRRVRIRAGSVVVPLHHPIRIAEDWSVVDNLSRGRVDLSLAIGWHPDDFVLSPETYSDREDITFSSAEAVRKIWSGEPYRGPNGMGEPTSVRIHPPPVQKELPLWLTCTGKPQRFIQAGQGGYNVLTALIFQPVDKLAERITDYRKARSEHGHDPSSGKITLMLHTFVGDSVEHVRESVKEPLKQYLRSSVDLWRKENKSLERLTERADALEFAYQRYFSTSGLFGTVESCRERVEMLRSIGVDEIACLIDFGVSESLTMQSLARLTELMESAPMP